MVAALVSSGLALGTTAAHAATAQEMSSLVFWGANGDHADLVLEYGPSGAFHPVSVRDASSRSARQGTTGYATLSGRLFSRWLLRPRLPVE